MEEISGFVGILEKVKRKSDVSRHNFPSKFGGLPAWLIPIPPKRPSCDACANDMSFLLQIYAPVEYESGFHRTIYLFACMRCGDRFSTFRCQLPRINDHYPADFVVQKVVKEDEDVCNKCGFEAHRSAPVVQIEQAEIKDVSFPCMQTQLPEMKISVEEADTGDDGDGEADDLEKELKALSGFNQSIDDDEIDLIPEGIGLEDVTDKVWEDYKNFMEANPGHVVYYSRHGSPMWLAESGQPNTSTSCMHCGGPRVFEFQVQSSLVAALGAKAGALDFGVLAVYTCAKSCNQGGQYGQEFACVQKEPESWWSLQNK